MTYKSLLHKSLDVFYGKNEIYIIHITKKTVFDICYKKL